MTARPIFFQTSPVAFIASILSRDLWSRSNSRIMFPGRLSLAKVLAGLLLLLVLLAGGAYVYARSGLLTLDDEARKLAPGQFVALSDGVVHYMIHEAVSPSPEAEAGRSTVVLVHGFSTPSFVWAGLIEPLTEANMTVLIYDNFGRGFSDRPRTGNDAALFDRQLLELLESQGITEPINLVGYSMGGAIATYFTAHHPEKIRRLGLIAPAGFPVNAGPAAAWLQLPILGDWLMALVGRDVLLDVMSQPENQGRAIPDIAERYGEQMSYEGYLRSLLSTMRTYPMSDLKEEYEAIGKAKIPTLAIWGDSDSVIPPGNAALVMKAVPQARVELIAGGTHAITYSEPERVSRALVNFVTQ